MIVNCSSLDMANKKLLQFLCLVLGIIISTSCKDRFTGQPTIVTGKVVDENGNPVGGIGLDLEGINQNGITQLIPTFRTQTIVSVRRTHIV